MADKLLIAKISTTVLVTGIILTSIFGIKKALVEKRREFAIIYTLYLIFGILYLVMIWIFA